MIERPNQEYIDTLTDRCRKYIADLESIVGELPKDAEGNPIPPGQRLYFSLDDVKWEATSVMCLEQDESQHAPLEAMAWSMWHQSAEAAEKARQA